MVAFSASLVGQTRTPERKVEGSVITSARDPRVRIDLPRSAQYVGADRWILYEIADCELHAFVDADSQKRIQRLYWVQFESYVPGRPELHHTYDSPRHTRLTGLNDRDAARAAYHLNNFVTDFAADEGRFATFAAQPG